MQGGGHRGTTMRFGNDEVQPNEMKRDGLPNEDPAENADQTDYNDRTGCYRERKILAECFQDNPFNPALCKETDLQMKDCERDFALHLNEEKVVE